jgi:heptosyltransferase I
MQVEKEYGEQISAEGGPGITNLVGRTKLKELLAIIEKADLLICPDSGPAHMATAVGTPVIGLYATSNRWRTGPYLSQHLAVDRYPEAVQAEFGKPVEELRWGQRVRDPAAMDLISLDDVKTQIDKILAGGNT